MRAFVVAALLVSGCGLSGAQLSKIGAAMSGASASMSAAMPSAVGTPSATTCFFKSESTSGFNKICVYDCLGSAYATTISATSLCPLTLSH